ncbi:hypothetical protein [Virgibacillus sp. SK37]|uniref:hypothetical protein n=1 Tax=Virgibacillus sp. SK37 TaxID=403957 RepID=UPI0004D16D25|nr:hypothetical protein [Virgibacillus sp. SK37]AIF45175.1 hypothetical protein X953_03430 [Virgibacillus sp. SK37]
MIMVKKERPYKQTLFNLSEQDRLELDLEDQSQNEKDEVIDRVYKKIDEKNKHFKKDNV